MRDYGLVHRLKGLEVGGRRHLRFYFGGVGVSRDTPEQGTDAVIDHTDLGGPGVPVLRELIDD